MWYNIGLKKVGIFYKKHLTFQVFCGIIGIERVKVRYTLIETGIIALKPLNKGCKRDIRNDLEAKTSQYG